MQSITSPLISEHEGTINRTGGDGDKSRLLLYSPEKKALTLKSLNTRYVKLIRKMAVMGVSLLLAIVSLFSLMCWCAEASGFNQGPREADNLIPAMQGAAAIRYLKERKLYDSLTVALNMARPAWRLLSCYSALSQRAEADRERRSAR